MSLPAIMALEETSNALALSAGSLKRYRAVQSLQLTELQARVLEAISQDKLEAASLRDLVSAYKILKEKELLLEGKPSEIKGLVSYLIALETGAESAEGPGSPEGFSKENEVFEISLSESKTCSNFERGTEDQNPATGQGQGQGQGQRQLICTTLS